MSPYSPDFNKELFYEPTDEELGNIEAGPGKVASVGGLLGRFARKMVADPIRGMYRAVDKARTGKFKDSEEVGKAAFEFAGNMAGTPGGTSGLGSGARIAKPWQSRTLDTISGVLPAGKKFPDAATPQTWLSKLKGAGLPKEELEIAQGFLDTADPKSKLNRQQLTAAIGGDRLKEWQGLKPDDPKLMLGGEYWNARQLPEMGVTVTELGGPKWLEGQKKLDDLPTLINNTKIRAESRIHELYKEKGGPVSREEYMADPEYQEIMKLRKGYLDEQLQLSTDAVGKRPRWPQYNTEGVQNPREVLYHGKPKSGEQEYINSDMETHYGSDQGKNLIFHQREGELTLPDGKKSTHISEQQSDWHSEYDKSVRPNKEAVYYQEGMDGEAYPIAPRRYIEIAGDDRSGFALMDVRDGTEFERFATRQEAEQHLSWNTGKDTDYKVPEPPMKDTWHKTGFKDAVKRAVEAGHDYLTWDTADTQIKRWPAGEGAEKYFRGHYDDKLVKFAAKEYGVKPEKIHTKDAIVADVPVLPRADKPNTTSVRIDPDFIAVENVPGSRDRYYLRVPEIGSQYSSGFRIDNRIFKSYDEGWAAREEFINQLEKFKGPDNDSTAVWRIPITDDMKRKVLLEGQYWSKKDKAATPGGRNAEGIA